jgi:hypothetical protein
MVEYLRTIPEVEVIIIDNASTYPPLLEWYLHCPVRVMRLKVSQGPRAALSGCIEYKPNERFIITDSDLDLSAIPKDFLRVLNAGLDQNSDICKVGLSLELNDLPSDGIVAGAAKEVEAGYWTTKRGDFYVAGIDTTFALYRGSNFPCVYGPALRSDRPYVARHLSWYITPNNVTEEDRYYFDHLDPNWAHNLFYSPRTRHELKKLAESK